MRKEILHRVARNVANELIPAETALDEALASVVRLIGTTVDGRLQANLPASCAHKAISGMGVVAHLITQAREELVNVHGELAIVQSKTAGLRTVSFGDQMGCPPPLASSETNVVPIAA